MNGSVGNVTQADLRLLGFYSLLYDWFLRLYPEEMATSVAPPIAKEALEGKLKEAYERLISSLEEELATNVKEKAKEDFLRVTDLVKQIEAASTEAKEALLKKHADVKEYLIDQTLEHLHKLR